MREQPYTTGFEADSPQFRAAVDKIVAAVERPKVAALFVDPNGVYSGLPDVEVWDEARDARLYPGPWPVVAHPPCARWSIMGNCRPEYAKGDDGGCFEAALAAVRRFGGVLEHPRYSLAWKHFGLPRPLGAMGWTHTLFGDAGWTCEVDQRLYGLNARKPTWLYYFGYYADPPDMLWDRVPAGELSTRGGRKGYGPEVSTHNNHYMRAATPPLFRDALLTMAARANLLIGSRLDPDPASSSGLL